MVSSTDGAGIIVLDKRGSVYRESLISLKESRRDRTRRFKGSWNLALNPEKWSSNDSSI